MIDYQLSTIDHRPSTISDQCCIPVNAPSPPTPRRLFRMLDAREITPEEFREAMAYHARGLIAEMEEVHQNPIAAWLETLKNRRAASRLAREHGEPKVREVLLALSDLPDFPLANWLWDADQPSVPLYCFLRSRREPVFRILKIASAPFVLSITVEYGGLKRGAAVRERFAFGRDRLGRLALHERTTLT